MSLTLKKSRGHNAFGLSVYPSVCSFVCPFKKIEVRILKLTNLTPHQKKADPYFFSLDYLPS